MTALRVLHVSAYFAPAFVYGGPPRSILGLCKALAQTGIDVDVMTTTANGRGRELEPAVAAPRRIDGVRARYFPLAEPRWLWHAPLLRQALRRELGWYDVVHIHGLWHLPAWHAARLARRLDVPYVVSPRGMLEPEALAIHHARKAVAFRLVERRNLQGAAYLHATSPIEAATLAERELGPPVVLAPNGVDIEPLGVDPERRYVLFLGRLHPIKRLDLLAAAAARLAARDACVVVAGPDEKGHRADLTPLFEASGLTTIFTGAVDGPWKAALLSSARALVLCSDAESFGLTAAEAMAAGTPVVVTDTCPWSEIERERAGRFVPQTADAIAGALDSILADEHAARAMGVRGRALVARRYTWIASAQVLAECYRQVAGRQTVARAV
jgi:glycosyltransferase involved in cell wall biosynthesis